MLPYVSAPVGGASLRNAAVAANPTMGGSSENAALIRPSIYPRFRGTTSNSSMTLQIVGVSYLASAAIVAVEIMVRWAEKSALIRLGRRVRVVSDWIDARNSCIGQRK